MNYSQLSRRDEDALFNRIDGENDALILDAPALNNYYYLLGWYDTKTKLKKGELTKRERKY